MAGVSVGAIAGAQRVGSSYIQPDARRPAVAQRREDRHPGQLMGGRSRGAVFGCVRVGVKNTGRIE